MEAARATPAARGRRRRPGPGPTTASTAVAPRLRSASDHDEAERQQDEPGEQVAEERDGAAAAQVGVADLDAGEHQQHEGAGLDQAGEAEQSPVGRTGEGDVDEHHRREGQRRVDEHEGQGSVHGADPLRSVRAASTARHRSAAGRRQVEPDNLGRMNPTYLLAAVDLVAVLVLAMAVYYPRHRRADLVTAFIAVNVGVLAVTIVLSSSAATVGLGLGLFGVLSIIRLRSDELGQHEIAYYFAALAIGLIGGLGTGDVALSITLMAALVGVLALADSRLLHGTGLRQVVVLDSAITDEATLVERLEMLLDARVTRVTPVRVDLVNDTTTVEVHYAAAPRPALPAGGAPRGRGGHPMSAVDRLPTVSLAELNERGRAADPHRPQVRHPGRRPRRRAHRHPGPAGARDRRPALLALRVDLPRHRRPRQLDLRRPTSAGAAGRCARGRTPTPASGGSR